MSDFIDLATLGTGSVVAPAGHGKTYAVGRTLKEHPELRVLVLTHTNAGIAALMRRIGKGVNRNTRIETIAALSLRLARAFPTRGRWRESEELQMNEIQPAALRVLSSPTVLSVFAAGFDLVIVDEFQDCSADQMETVELLSRHIRTVVLGDPLQAIHDFGPERTKPWPGFTEALPYLGTLPTPHRWSRTNPGLGQWLALTRAELENGRMPVFDKGAPVQIVTLDRHASQGSLYGQLGRSGTTAIVSPDPGNLTALSRIARNYRGKVRVAESAELRELRTFAKDYDAAGDAAHVLILVIDFVATTRTNVRNSTVTTLRKSLANRGQPSNSKNAVVATAAGYLRERRVWDLARFARLLATCDGGSNYRPQLQTLFVKALSIVADSPGQSLEECVSTLIEGLRHRSSWEPFGTVVGTTLRLKGLEFDNVVVLNPESIKGVNHLYVALSRASTNLVIANSPT